MHHWSMTNYSYELVQAPPREIFSKLQNVSLVYRVTWYSGLKAEPEFASFIANIMRFREKVYVNVEFGIAEACD